MYGPPRHQGPRGYMNQHSGFRGGGSPWPRGPRPQAHGRGMGHMGGPRGPGPRWGSPDMGAMETWGVGPTNPRPIYNKRPHPGPPRHQQRGFEKRPKIDKRDLPENNNFFCETCDRGFKTPDKFKEHTDGHIKCSHQGCPYTAAPKLVQNHISQQHRNGLARKIWSLESKEDIAKWIAERKRNFPTKVNVDKMAKVRAEMEARGEVIETKQFGKMRGRGRGRGRGGDRDRGRGRGRGNRRGGRGGRHFREESSDVGQADERATEIRPDEPKVPSLQSVRISSNLTDDPLAFRGDGSDSEEAESSVIPVEETYNKPPANKVSGALGLLCANYSDSEGSQDDGEGGAAQSIARPATGPRPPCSEDKDTEKETNKEECEDKIEKAWDDTPSSTNKKAERPPPRLNSNENRKPYGRHKSQHRQVPKKQLSLLEKLLANEIRHERNVLMQCIKYVVKHNFFVSDRNTAQQLLHSEKCDTTDTADKNDSPESGNTSRIDEEVWEDGL